MKSAPWSKMWRREIGAVSDLQVKVTAINNVLKYYFGGVPEELGEIGTFLMDLVGCHEETRVVLCEQFAQAKVLRMLHVELIITNFLEKLPSMKVAPPEFCEPIVSFDRSIELELQHEQEEEDLYDLLAMF